MGGHTYGELIAFRPEVHTADEQWGSVVAHYHCACGEYFTENKVETTLEVLTGPAPVHTFGDWINTGPDMHWKQCVCGFATETGGHVFDNDQDADCNTCGYARTITHEHTFATTLSYDVYNHWYAEPASIPLS